MHVKFKNLYIDKVISILNNDLYSLIILKYWKYFGVFDI